MKIVGSGKIMVGAGWLVVFKRDNVCRILRLEVIQIYK